MTLIYGKGSRQSVRTEDGKPRGVQVMADYEYEYLFKAEDDEICPIDGWFPVATDRFTRPVEELIAMGRVRRINHSHSQRTRDSRLDSAIT
jgi:hypothetical protein